jgi:hypothetical protein
MARFQPKLLFVLFVVVRVDRRPHDLRVAGDALLLA